MRGVVPFAPRVVLIMVEQKLNRLKAMRDGLAAEAAKRGLTRLQ